MWIKFTDSVAGDRFAYRRGQRIDLRVDIAKGFIKAGQAEALSAEEIELAVGGAVETAARRPAGPARRRSFRNLGGLIP